MIDQTATEAGLDQAAQSATRPFIWHDFIAVPGHYLAAQKLADAMGQALPVEFCAQLRTCERIQPHLTRLIIRHFALPNLSPDDKPSTTVSGLLQLSEDALATLAVNAGAIFWSHLIAGEIRANEIALLKRTLGEAAYGFAVKHRDLGNSNPQPVGANDLNTAIIRDGAAAIASCFMALPASMQPWLGLHLSRCFLPANGFADASSRQLSELIVQRLLQDSGGGKAGHA